MANIDPITWCFLPGHSGDLSVGNSLEIEESIKYIHYRTKDFRGRDSLFLWAFVVALVRPLTSAEPKLSKSCPNELKFCEVSRN